MYKLGVIGAGVMATAIIERIIEGNTLNKGDIIVSDISKSRIDYFNAWGILATDDISAVISSSENILFAVKPQNYQDILKQYSSFFNSNHTVLSIMAGVKISTLKERTGVQKIVRIMPNMPCILGEGAIAVAFNNISDKQYYMNLLAPLGTVIEIAEKNFDTVTAVSGSGPAYVYMFIKGLTQAGIDGGLTAEQSRLLAVQTFIGAAKLAKNSSEDLEILIDRVCSKGGTTIEAINFFRENKLEEIIEKGAEACRKRSEELSGLL